MHYGLFRLCSIEDGDGAGTGNFHINIQSSGQLVIESNNIANFYLKGNVREILLNFYFGNGRFYGEELHAQNIKVYHRGSNDMFVYPIQKLEGQILSTGNIILKNIPLEIEIEELYTGGLIY